MNAPVTCVDIRRLMFNDRLDQVMTLGSEEEFDSRYVPRESVVVWRIPQTKKILDYLDAAILLLENEPDKGSLDWNSAIDCLHKVGELVENE